MRSIILSPVACLVQPILRHYLIKDTIKKNSEHKMRVLIFSTNFV